MDFDFKATIDQLQEDFRREFDKELFDGTPAKLSDQMLIFSYAEGPIHQTAIINIETELHNFYSGVLHKVKLKMEEFNFPRKTFYCKDGKLFYVCDEQGEPDAYVLTLHMHKQVYDVNPGIDTLCDILDAAYKHMWIEDKPEAYEWLKYYHPSYEAGIESVERAAVTALWDMVSIYNVAKIGNMIVWHDTATNETGISNRARTHKVDNCEGLFKTLMEMAGQFRDEAMYEDIAKFKEYLVRVTNMDPNMSIYKGADDYCAKYNIFWDEKRKMYMHKDTPKIEEAHKAIFGSDADFWRTLGAS